MYSKFSLQCPLTENVQFYNMFSKRCPACCKMTSGLFLRLLMTSVYVSIEIFRFSPLIVIFKSSRDDGATSFYLAFYYRYNIIKYH